MQIKRFENKQAFSDYLAQNSDAKIHKDFERKLMQARQALASFELDSYCKACEQPQAFLVDKLYGSQITEQGWLPNWRERLSCPQCQLNNRQRAVIHAIKNTLKTLSVDNNKSLSLYAIAQL